MPNCVKAYGDPIDGGPAVEGTEVEIGGPSVNPVRRKQPSELIATGIAGIDLNNTLVSGLFSLNLIKNNGMTAVIKMLGYKDQ